MSVCVCARVRMLRHLMLVLTHQPVRIERTERARPRLVCAPLAHLHYLPLDSFTDSFLADSGL